MTVDPEILAARARVVAARARLDASVTLAKAKLSPRSLASDAVDSAASKASQVAQDGLQIVRDRPATAAAIGGAIALALARKPLIGWAAGLLGRDDATGDDDVS